MVEKQTSTADQIELTRNAGRTAMVNLHHPHNHIQDRGFGSLHQIPPWIISEFRLFWCSTFTLSGWKSQWHSETCSIQERSRPGTSSLRNEIETENHDAERSIWRPEWTISKKALQLEERVDDQKSRNWWAMHSKRRSLICMVWLKIEKSPKELMRWKNSNKRI